MTEDTRPFTHHPAFRWLVGLWFAALLGGGLFVMPRSVHRMIARPLGLGELPGDTLRLGIAAVAALIGLALGLLIAGRRAPSDQMVEDYSEADAYDAAPAPALETPAWEPAPDMGQAEPAPRRARVFSAREELGDDGIPAPHHLAEGPALHDAFPEPVTDEVATWEPAEPDPYSQPRPAPPPRPAESLGDLPLPALVARLEQALRRARGDDRVEDVAPNERIIPMPRRGEDETAPPAAPAEAETALRSALDKLSRFRPDA